MKHYNHELLNRVKEKKNKTKDAARSAKCIRWHICTYFHSFHVSALICTEQVGIAWGASDCVSTGGREHQASSHQNPTSWEGNCCLEKTLASPFAPPRTALHSLQPETLELIGKPSSIDISCCFFWLPFQEFISRQTFFWSHLSPLKKQGCSKDVRSMLQVPHPAHTTHSSNTGHWQQ